jgi:antitoxin component of MazEF toxin-antitoxin module
MKSMYVLQPYLVGSKSAKSLAMIIPAKVRKEAKLDSSSVFVLKIHQKTKMITLKNVTEKYENMMPADESSQASKQQASLEVQ